MRGIGKQDRSRAQRQLRQRRGERAFVFDKELSRCFGKVEREQWEIALSICRGDVVCAARELGLDDVPRGAKALWGRSAQEALGIYRRWRKQRNNR